VRESLACLNHRACRQGRDAAAVDEKRLEWVQDLPHVRDGGGRNTRDRIFTSVFVPKGGVEIWEVEWLRRADLHRSRVVPWDARHRQKLLVFNRCRASARIASGSSRAVLAARFKAKIRTVGVVLLQAGPDNPGWLRYMRLPELPNSWKTPTETGAPDLEQAGFQSDRRFWWLLRLEKSEWNQIRFEENPDQPLVVQRGGKNTVERPSASKPGSNFAFANRLVSVRAWIGIQNGNSR